MSRGTLAYSVSSFDPEARFSYPAGTDESEIDEAHRALIRDKCFGPPRSEVDAGLDEAPPLDVPTVLEECTADELLVIAEMHGVDLGRVRNPEKVIAILKAAGIGVDS